MLPKKKKLPNYNAHEWKFSMYGREFFWMRDERKFKSLRWFNGFNGLMVGRIFHFEQLIRLVFGVLC
jgi:hypothetical protein